MKNILKILFVFGLMLSCNLSQGVEDNKAESVNNENSVVMLADVVVIAPQMEITTQGVEVSIDYATQPGEMIKVNGYLPQGVGALVNLESVVVLSNASTKEPNYNKLVTYKIHNKSNRIRADGSK